MKSVKRAHTVKRFAPLLLVLCGGCIILGTSGVFLAHSLIPSQKQHAMRGSGDSPALSYNESSIQTHNTTPTSISIAVPFASPTANSKTTASPTSTTSAGGPTSTSTPAPGGNPGSTLPPGSALPSESACAARISPSSFEPRPDNYAANHRVPTASQIANIQPWGPLIGMDGKSDNLRRQITGNYTGTTDEILQWVACKWGIDVNIVRAEAVQESNWHQSQLGDYTNTQSLCPPGAWNGSSCYQSYGILQIKYTYFKTEWPMSQQDTAFNAEFVYGWIRNCYEGLTDYLYNVTPSPGYPRYHAGDIWGCLGFWFSGSWYTGGAINYINTIQQDYQQKPWLKAGF